MIRGKRDSFKTVEDQPRTLEFRTRLMCIYTLYRDGTCFGYKMCLSLVVTCSYVERIRWNIYACIFTTCWFVFYISQTMDRTSNEKKRDGMVESYNEGN